VERAAQVGEALGQALRAGLSDSAAVGDVRGIGMMWAVELVVDRASREPFAAELHAADRAGRRCMNAGVLVYPGHGGADGKRGDHLMVAPPYVVSESQITTVVEVLQEVLADLG